jgi:hypothetical protein
MKILIISFVALISLSAFAGASEEVFIRGVISNSFDDEKVKVKDSLGQIYFLPRSVFPADFKFKQGEPFALEVNAKDIEQVKLLKK